MNLLSLLRKKSDDNNEVRDQELTTDQWTKMFSHLGNLYNLNGFSSSGTKTEVIENDFRSYVNGAYKSSGIVYACCAARASVFSEAEFALRPRDSKRTRDITIDDPALDLLEIPWPNGTTGELLFRAIQDVDLAGNHYMLREDKGGKPRLRRLRPDWVDIVLTEKPEDALRSDVAGYIYRPGGTQDREKWEVFPIDGSNGTVAHWSPVPDPDAQYRGMSWLTPVIREILADKSIAKHKLKFFDNAATPGIAVSYSDTVSPEDLRDFKEIFDAAYTGADKAYKPMHLGGGADVTVVGSKAAEIDFATITGIGEARIANAARVHPAIIGIQASLAGASMNEGNFAAAKDHFGSGTIRPLWRSICAAYSVLVNVPTGKRLWYSDRDIAFLLEDHTKVAQRQQIQATSISRYVMQGYTADSARDCIEQDDLELLKHTGLFSVQLLPPGISNPEEWGDKNKNGVSDYQEQQDKKAEKDGKKPASGKSESPGQSKGNNTPTGSKRKPVGRPPTGNPRNDEWFDALQRGDDWDDLDPPDEEEGGAGVLV